MIRIFIVKSVLFGLFVLLISYNLKPDAFTPESIGLSSDVIKD
jgi:hypothetical protein